MIAKPRHVHWCILRDGAQVIVAGHKDVGMACNGSVRTQQSSRPRCSPYRANSGLLAAISQGGTTMLNDR